MRRDFDQFGALYMHNHDDNIRSGFKPGNSRLQAPVDTNEPGLAGWVVKNIKFTKSYTLKIIKH